MADSTILVVEDDPTTADFLTDVLSEAGYNVASAPDGPTALLTLKTLRVNLILCDLLLPGMSGDQLCRELANCPNLRQIPVLLITAVPASHRPDTASFVGVIEKPFDLDALLDTVATALAQSNKSRPASQDADQMIPVAV